MLSPTKTVSGAGTGICIPLLVSSRFPLHGNHTGTKENYPLAWQSFAACFHYRVCTSSPRHSDKDSENTAVKAADDVSVIRKDTVKQLPQKPPPCYVLLNYLSRVKETCAFTITYMKRT